MAFRSNAKKQNVKSQDYESMLVACLRLLEKADMIGSLPANVRDWWGRRRAAERKASEPPVNIFINK